MGLEDLSRFASLLEAGLCALVCEGERRLANQCKHDLGLITCKRG